MFLLEVYIDNWSKIVIVYFADVDELQPLGPVRLDRQGTDELRHGRRRDVPWRRNSPAQRRTGQFTETQEPAEFSTLVEAILWMLYISSLLAKQPNLKLKTRLKNSKTISHWLPLPSC